jgi:citrate lyase subunit beta/citryl-CoA lyase
MPANVERFIAKAHTRGADGYILDLEDSVPPQEKASARDNIQETAKRVSQNGADVLVRINRPLELAVADIQATVSYNVHALLLPKLMGPEHVRLLAELVDKREAELDMEQGWTRFVAMVETAEAFLVMDRIAAAHPRIAAIEIGGEDFAMSLGMRPGPETLRHSKEHSIIAARAAGVMPMGLMGTVADYQDLEAARASARSARESGIEGASCIHPSIVPVLNEEFSPAPEEVASAKRVVEAYRKAEAAGRGSIQVDGKMVDVPVVERALHLLKRHERISTRQTGS